ncbi:MAG: Cof-type HAD-IIB family hydrolase [Eubacteriales bacterium]|nr:Cof-type HAD-IIB family hydrolase [Eubacteriales bacterium]
MSSSKIKLIALDLDGTLLSPEGQVHPIEQDTLQQVRRAGVSVAIATGRSIQDTLPYAQAAGGVDWIITENGARIQSADGQTIYQRTMPQETLTLLLRLCEKYAVEPCFYGDDIIWYGRQCRRFHDNVMAITGHPLPLQLEHFRYVDSWAQWYALTRENVYKAIVYGDAADLDTWLTALAETGQFAAEPSVFCGMKNIEINQRGTDKGAALLQLAAQLQLTHEQVMACGDSDNDRTMLQAAGLGIAMANAPAHIRALADAVTDTNDQHGVAQAVRKYVLGDG